MNYHVDELRIVDINIKINASDFEFERILGREKLIILLQKGCKVYKVDTVLRNSMSLIYSSSTKEVEDRLEEKSFTVNVVGRLKDKDVLNNTLIDIRDILNSYENIMQAEVTLSLRS